MFQIIVAVVAIALVAIMAIAMIWYGGSVFSSAGEKGRFDGYVQQGTQIQASIKLYNVDTGGLPSGTSDAQFSTLQTNNYLSSTPPGGWIIDNQVIYKPLTDNAQCKRFNQYAGKDVSDTVQPTGATGNLASYEGCPPCDDSAWAAYPGCQSGTVTGGGSANASTGTGNGG